MPFRTHSELAAVAPRADIDAVLAARAASGGPLRLLVASRLIYSKGVQYALRALAQAADRLPDWRLDVLGDGVYRAELERLAGQLGIASRVVFHGHTVRAAVDDFYRNADIFLFPSVREPSGAVIFEAMSWGLPQIAAAYGGPATHVEDAFGVRVPVTSAQGFIDGFAAAIERLGNSRALRARMGEAAVAAARERYSMTEMVDFFTDIYAQLGKRAPKPSGV